MVELFECVVVDDAGIYKATWSFVMPGGTQQSYAEDEVFKVKGLKVGSGEGDQYGTYLKEVNWIKTVESIWVDNFSEE